MLDLSPFYKEKKCLDVLFILTLAGLYTLSHLAPLMT